jgi:hypothetical protein
MAPYMEQAKGVGIDAWGLLRFFTDNPESLRQFMALTWMTGARGMELLYSNWEEKGLTELPELRPFFPPSAGGTLEVMS